jgi:predicted O-methyltransferase YrrM
LGNLLPMMKPGGLVVFDDVDTHWREIQEVFEQIDRFGMKAIATDGRLGIAQAL